MHKIKIKKHILRISPLISGLVAVVVLALGLFLAKYLNKSDHEVITIPIEELEVSTGDSVITPEVSGVEESGEDGDNYTLPTTHTGTVLDDSNKNADSKQNLTHNNKHKRDGKSGKIKKHQPNLKPSPRPTPTPIPELINQDPVVSIDMGLDGKSFNLGEDILVRGSAVDPDGTVVDMTLYLNGASYATTASSDYTFILHNLPIGEYQLYIRALDDKGGVGISKTLTIYVDAKDVFNPDISEPLSNPLSFDLSDIVSGAISFGLSEQISGVISDIISGDISSEISSVISDALSGIVSDLISSYVSTAISIEISDQLSDTISGIVSAIISVDISIEISNPVSDPLPSLISSTVSDLVLGDTGLEISSALSGLVSTSLSEILSSDVPTAISLGISRFLSNQLWTIVNINLAL